MQSLLEEELYFSGLMTFKINSELFLVTVENILLLTPNTVYLRFPIHSLSTALIPPTHPTVYFLIYKLNTCLYILFLAYRFYSDLIYPFWVLFYTFLEIPTVQLTLEQYWFQLHESTYLQIFVNNM